MRIKKGALRDCMIYGVVDGQDGTVSIECGFVCERCGFDKNVMEVRKERIRNHEWSWDSERKVAYLALKEGR